MSAKTGRRESERRLTGSNKREKFYSEYPGYLEYFFVEKKSVCFLGETMGFQIARRESGQGEFAEKEAGSFRQRERIHRQIWRDWYRFSAEAAETVII